MFSFILNAYAVRTALFFIEWKALSISYFVSRLFVISTQLEY